MKNKKLFAILTLVCFMMTLMPVAAFAAVDTTVDAETSYLTMTSDKTVVTTDDAISYTFTARNAARDEVAAKGFLYVWAKDKDTNNTTSAVVVTDADGNEADPAGIATKNVYVIDAAGVDTDFKVSFVRDGDYTVYVAFAEEKADATAKIADLTVAIGSGEDVITVLGTTTNPDNYTMELVGDGVLTGTQAGEEDADYVISTLKPNNISKKYVMTFKANGKTLSGQTVTIETDSDNIAVDKETATIKRGEVKFELSASREGDYTIYVTVEGKVFTILVKCGNTSAAYIETVEEPENLIAQFTTDFDGVAFEITDINGNMVEDLAVAGGADGLRGKDANVAKVKYLYYVEKPAASTLRSETLELDPTDVDGKYELDINGTLDAEGVYTVKVILDNGAFATATWEVKRFQTPVELRIKAAATVELGKTLVPELEYVDVNGVVKDATDAKLAATGYAIYSFDKNGKITLKTDEKYAGQTITLTAVSERYDLVAAKEVKIAAEATDIAFVDKNLAVDVNNKVVWNVVDADGNVVRLNDIQNFKVRYVVLDKPADAKVSVYDVTDRPFNGEGKMAITSNKVGNVTVQAVAQVQVAQNGNEAIQTKYYTGTQIFAVGTEGVGDVVVMSVGSNEIVINDKKAAIDAAPIVKNDRTFVPFRALAEAFGAEVAYDEATQAVTAELNGVKVVMTIGSATYTVNGAEKTMDVAPFINGSRTMVPVRFVAEAFGIKVIPTYDENGATADILFNL